MRSTTLAMAIQSLSLAQDSAILLVTADPVCGDSAYLALSFMPEDAVAILKHSGTVVVKAETTDEYLRMRAMTNHFEIAFDDQPRLGAEAVFFQAGTLVYRNTCDGVQPSRLAA